MPSNSHSLCCLAKVTASETLFLNLINGNSVWFYFCMNLLDLLSFSLLLCINQSAKTLALDDFRSCCSKDNSASVVYGATDLQNHHNQQVQEKTGAAHGLPEDVSS